MAVGSAVLGGVADRIGRRPAILGCLAVMATGMVMATTASGLAGLSTWRIVTGLGIGGMLAAINAVSMEFSNTRRRHLSVSLMSIGYLLGAVFGGMVAAQLLRGNDWRTVFYFGAGVTAVLIPVVFFFVPESVHWLVRKQPGNALTRVNRSLGRIGYATVDRLPDIPAEARNRSFGDIFAAQQVAGTVIVTLAYFLHITTFYFIVKWVPKIVVDLGFAASAAAGVLVWTNVGGAIGGAVLGLLTQKFSVKTLTIGVLLASTVAVTAFGRTPADLQRLSIICGLCGFCINAGIVGLYAIIAQVFPRTSARAGRASRSASGAAAGCLRRSSQDSCLPPAIRSRRWRFFSASARSAPGRCSCSSSSRPIVRRLNGRMPMSLPLTFPRPRTRGRRRHAFIEIRCSIRGVRSSRPHRRGIRRARAGASRPRRRCAASHQAAARLQGRVATAAARGRADGREHALHAGGGQERRRRSEGVRDERVGDPRRGTRGAHRSWTGLATSPVAVTLRDKRNYVDLTGLARLRWMVRTSSIHTLYPVVKLADGSYIAGNRGISTDGEFLQVEVVFAGMRCTSWIR